MDVSNNVIHGLGYADITSCHMTTEVHILLVVCLRCPVQRFDSSSVSLSMENCSNNTSCTPSNSFPGPTDSKFASFVIVLDTLELASIVFSLITIAALCSVYSVAKLVRIFLINFLIAGVVLALFVIFASLSAIIIGLTTLPPPPLDVCRVAVWSVAVSSVARLYGLTAFSIVVLLMVKYHIKVVRNVYIAISLAAIWFVAILVHTHVLVPRIFAIQYQDGTACFSTLDDTIIKPARYTFTALWITFGVLSPLTISIVIAVVVLCYVRRNTILAGSSYNKGLAKFVLFLAVGNIINGLALICGVSMFYFPQRTIIYLAYFITSTFHISTPILVILFLKPVRDKIRSVFCLCCHRSQPVYIARKTLQLPLIEND